VLSSTAQNEEKDLEAIISDTLKPSSQCVAAAKSANKTLGMNYDLKNIL